MRCHLRWLAAVLIAVGMTAQAQAQKKPDFGEPTCGDYGTSVKFEKTPKEAATKALKEEKLVLVIHISGHFEEPDYT